MEVYKLYNIYKKSGIFPNGDCYLNQPAKLIETFDLFDILNSKLEVKELNKQKKKERIKSGRRS